MPELPEVETIRRVLEPQLKGLAIESVTVNRPEVVSRPTAEAFCQQLAGQTVSAMTRRGKFLGIELHSGDHIVLHLRMTGCLLLTPASFPAEKHTHLIFRMDNGKELRFSDQRRFGRFWLLRAGETDTCSGVNELGIEPLSAELSAGSLRECCGKRRKAIKACLLDQRVIAGIGNIYSDEILFEARIHPSRPANSLTENEWLRLVAAIAARIRFFIEKNAITPEEYWETKGQDYRNTPYLRVYGHGGEPCPVCGENLCRAVIAGRSSVYCPVCQGAL